MEITKFIQEFLRNTLYVNIATFMGVLLTLLGLIVTLVFSIKSRNAAMNAKTAVDKFRKDINRVDTITDLNQAISNIEEIKRLNRISAWPLLPERYSNLKKNLIYIMYNFPDISDDQKTKIVGVINHIRRIEEQIDQYLEQGISEIQFSGINRILSREIEAMFDLLNYIQKSQGK
jgi:hypothetical protein